MDVTFATAKLQKVCNNANKLRSEYGPRMAVVIQRRLADLAAAPTLHEMRLLPGRCHELVVNLKGHLALDLEHPNRLVFKPLGSKIKNEHGTLEWHLVEAIEVVAIGNYH
jgi:plasmid maintenance system killer protein